MFLQVLNTGLSSRCIAETSQIEGWQVVTPAHMFVSRRSNVMVRISTASTLNRNMFGFGEYVDSTIVDTNAGAGQPTAHIFSYPQPLFVPLRNSNSTIQRLEFRVLWTDTKEIIYSRSGEETSFSFVLAT